MCSSVVGVLQVSLTLSKKTIFKFCIPVLNIQGFACHRLQDGEKVHAIGGKGFSNGRYSL
jgi:hypothetical protein